MKQKLIFTNRAGAALDDIVARIGAPKVVLISDRNVEKAVLPRLAAESAMVAAADRIIVEAGDEHKNLASLSYIWERLSDLEATRATLAINIGGGVVSDMGGFAAATFKRGIRCINVPTTLLSAVDASVGGKTGINFNGMKNQIGAFAEPEASVISTVYFDTLPDAEILSGYGEMLKHALLEGASQLDALLAFTPVYPRFDADSLMSLLRESVLVKERIVAADFTEQGLRKALNLGHTVGHAFESLALSRQSPVPHGYAVAWGLVVELILSNMLFKFPSETVHRLAQYIRDNYVTFAVDCKDYPAILAAMRQDKKNVSADAINFTLLSLPGAIELNSTASEEDIKTALDIYRDFFGI